MAKKNKKLVEEPKEVPEVEESKEVPEVEKPKEVPKVEEPKEVPEVEEPKEVPKVEKPKKFVQPWKLCNRCKTEMVEVSKDGFELILECPKCKARKSRC